MTNIILLLGAFWFAMGIIGSYLIDTDTNIVIARFSVALFMIMTAIAIEMLDRLNKIIKQQGQ